MGELLVFLKTLGHGRWVVVHIAVGGGPFMRPIVVAVPVGFGEVETRPEALFAEGFHHFAGDVGLGALRERTTRIDGGVGGFLCVEHTKAVVVFRGEDDIFHAGVFGGLGPFQRVEVLWVKGFVKILVISLVLVIIRAVAIDPRLVAYRPRLDHFPLGVDTPVHHKAEFQVLPLTDAIGDDGVCLGLLVVILCEDCHASQAE